MKLAAFPIAAIGLLASWLGFARFLGWKAMGQPDHLIGAPVALIGVCAILWAGYLLGKPVSRGFLLCAACFFIDAALLGYGIPKMVNAGSGQDGVVLASIMGAGVCVFFGLSLLIAAAMASLFSQGK